MDDWGDIILGALTFVGLILIMKILFIMLGGY